MGGAPTLTGVPFNDAYRYMDWLLTVPLLLIEILLVMKLSDAEYSSKAWALGLSSALMIVSGYYGELVVTGDLTPRWLCWFVSMGFFLYIVYELLVGLAGATSSETDPVIKGKIQTAQIMTVISPPILWSTFSPCSASTQPLPWFPLRLATACQTSFPSAVLAL